MGGVYNEHDSATRKGIAGIAELRKKVVSGNEIWLKYHTTAGDGGGGLFRGMTGKPAGYYTAITGTEPEDNGTIIVPTSGDGREAWVRDYTGAVNVKWFGAVGDGIADDTIAIQAATVAANGGISSGVGVGGTVTLPNGTYMVSPIGIRDTVLVGESMNGAVLKAITQYSSGNNTLLDASLDRDGVTANTSGGSATIQNLTIDGDLKGFNGVRTYGGGVNCHSCVITRCVDGFTGSLLMWSNIDSVYSYSNIGNGFVVDGDSTSTNFRSCWADSNGNHGFEIKRMTYSSFINCVGQNSVNADWYVGDSAGIITNYSLSFIACGSEGSNKEPFYFKKCRDVIIESPRIISASSLFDYIVLDDVAGTIIGYSHAGTPGAGKLSLSLINSTAGDGSLTIVSSAITITSGVETLWNAFGSVINADMASQSHKYVFNDPVASQRFTGEIANVDGYKGLVFSEQAGGSRSAGFSRTGSNVFKAVAFNNPSVNMNNNEVTFNVDTTASALKFTMKDGSGIVKTGSIPMV